ncbi:HNH endonuclease family protein [Streptomyces triculaminicus]|uniref:HNH endonuclease family protein n=1 Tax=Streptomyces triculaminicus TaxID=2816232 RepID=UPI0037D23B02
MRSQDISGRRYRRPILASLTAAAALVLAALPATDAHALPPPGPDFVHGLSVRPLEAARPMDYEEVDCEGPSAWEGDIYTTPPKVAPKEPKENNEPKENKENKESKENNESKEHAAPKAEHDENAHHHKTGPADMPVKAASDAPAKAASHMPAKTPADPAKAAANPAKAVPAAPGAHGSYRSFPAKWPKNVPDRDEATRLLQDLDVKPFNSKGYDRKHFGGASCWALHGPNRCTTRDLALKIQSVVPATLDGPCRVVGGEWRSEYDGRKVIDPMHVDVDHIVPLRHAWGSGANNWSPEKRLEFANDLTAAPQLIVVSTWSNRTKGDKGPEKWLPKGAECPYSQAWVAVKDYYGLSVTQEEKEKLLQILGKC